MYTVVNFRTKKELKAALGQGAKLHVFQPGPFGENGKQTAGKVYLEGPHYPAPHTWYAEAWLDTDGVIVKVK